MRDFKIYSYKYNIDLCKLINSRLRRSNIDCIPKSFSKTGVNIAVDDLNYDRFVGALTDFLLYDIMQLVIADIVNQYELELKNKRDILITAIYYANRASLRTLVFQPLWQYFKSNATLNLDGYIAFRMSETVNIWDGCVKKALNEYLDTLRQHQIEDLINRLFNAYTYNRPLTMYLHDDGSCTLIDGKNSKIDYPANSEGSIMGMLLSENPSELSVYNRAKNNSELINSLYNVFKERVVFYE